MTMQFITICSGSLVQTDMFTFTAYQHAKDISYYEYTEKLYSHTELAMCSHNSIVGGEHE